MDSAIHRYLKTVRETIQAEIKQHMRPRCYIRGPEEARRLCSLRRFSYGLQRGFSLLGMSLSGFPGAPDFFKCTCGDRLIKHGAVFLNHLSFALYTHAEHKKTLSLVSFMFGVFPSFAITHASTKTHHRHKNRPSSEKTPFLTQNLAFDITDSSSTPQEGSSPSVLIPLA
jgi:hypothetical protein